MKKLNNKGFTLIEMLVVIAIIAVLVAIIIPVVANSTTKAAAATDAANMRSLKAEIVTAYLQENAGGGKTITAIDSKNGKVTLDTTKISYPAMKDIGNEVSKFNPATDKTSNWSITFNSANNEFTIKYCGKTIADFAYCAENGEFPAATEVTG